MNKYENGRHMIANFPPTDYCKNTCLFYQKAVTILESNTHLDKTIRPSPNDLKIISCQLNGHSRILSATITPIDGGKTKKFGGKPKVFAYEQENTPECALPNTHTVIN